MREAQFLESARDRRDLFDLTGLPVDHLACVLPLTIRCSDPSFRFFDFSLDIGARALECFDFLARSQGTIERRDVLLVPGRADLQDRLSQPFFLPVPIFSKGRQLGDGPGKLVSPLPERLDSLLVRLSCRRGHSFHLLFCLLLFPRRGLKGLPPFGNAVFGVDPRRFQAVEDLAPPFYFFSGKKRPVESAQLFLRPVSAQLRQGGGDALIGGFDALSQGDYGAEVFDVGCLPGDQLAHDFRLFEEVFIRVSALEPP